MVSQVRQAAELSDAESVHDLRVSIRRLRECLRAFEDLYPAAPRKKLRKQLRKLMKRAEHVRTADVDIDLLHKAGLRESSPHVRKIRERRAQSSAALQHELRTFLGRPDLKKWHEALQL
jgi:CHAD domain-containing protein